MNPWIERSFISLDGKNVSYVCHSQDKSEDDILCNINIESINGVDIDNENKETIETLKIETLEMEAAHDRFVELISE